VNLPSHKEIHFFDSEAIDWNSPNYREYDARFAAQKNGQISGEATPIYTYWPGAIERASQYNPRFKIIVSLRNPVDRAFSHWKMEFGRGAETLSFGEAIREGRSRVASDARSKEGCHRVFSYVERGFYASQVVALMDHFPREQVHFINHDDLRTRFHQTLDDVCAFLSVAPFGQ
jgi:hypothetical protein